MKKIKDILKRTITIFLIFTLILLPTGKPKMPSIKASNGYPDLTIRTIRGLVQYPQDPKVGEAVTIEVVVENNGDAPSIKTRVSLDWCCSGIKRDIPAINNGESTSIKFEHALVFNQPGTYKLTATVDCDHIITEKDESNNEKTLHVVVELREEQKAPGDPKKWSDEWRQLIGDCPDTDLMKIGRKGPPYEMEDSNGDNIPDRLKRETESCDRDDDQTNDKGCQVYLKGQEENACGTTSLAYILRYFGKNVWPSDIDYELRGTAITDMFSEPMGLRDYAQSLGMNSEIYINGDINELRSFVESGIPVMLDISNTAGSTDVNNGHWVVVLSMCEIPSPVSPGTMDTVINIYDPNGVQFSITPERLEQFWGKLVYPVWDAEVYLWNKLYIAVSDKPLPPGNSREVSEQIAIARAITQFMASLDDFSEWNILDGLCGLVGSIATAVCGLVGIVFSWGEDVPYIGGLFGTLGDLCGNVAQGISTICDGIGDIFDPEAWAKPERLLSALVDVIEGVADIIVGAIEFVWDFLVDGIGEFFKSIFDGIESIGCDWFGWWCPDVYYKHFASTDPCLETTIFINGTQREKALGYIYTYPAPDTKPIWLYSNSTNGFYLDIHSDEGFATGDLNGDGICEVVYGSKYNGKIYIYDTNGNMIGSPFSISFESEERIAAGDVNGDGKDEIIFADDKANTISCFTIYGSGLVGGAIPPELNGIEAADGLTSGDVNGDGKDDIIHGDVSDHRIYVFDFNGTKIGHPFDIGYESKDRIAAGDVNGDGKDEVVLADDSENTIYIFDYNGVEIKALRNPCEIGDIEANEGLVVGDMDGDGIDEIIHGDVSDHKIYVFKSDGNKIGEPFDVGYESKDRVAAGDVNGDGKDEIIFLDWSTNILSVYNPSGNLFRSYLVSEQNLPYLFGNYINLGIIGHTLKSGTSTTIDLNTDLITKGIRIDGNVGYLLKEPAEGTELLWLMRSRVTNAYFVSVDKCDFTQTFLNPIAKYYTRESAVGMILSSETPDATKLYRFCNEEKEDCMLSTSSTDVEHFVNQGYVGYIYTTQKPGTVPLYQFYNSKRDDHFITLDINAEGLEGYGSYEMLGYVLSPSEVDFEDWKCNLPLWRFCKRVIKEE